MMMGSLMVMVGCGVMMGCGLMVLPFALRCKVALVLVARVVGVHLVADFARGHSLPFCGPLFSIDDSKLHSVDFARGSATAHQFAIVRVPRLTARSDGRLRRRRRGLGDLYN